MKKYRTLLIPLVSIVVLIVVYVFAGSYVYGRINTLNGEISQSQADQAKLQTKLSVLQATQGSVDTFSNKVILALPGTDNSLVALSQIKSLAEAQGLIVSNVGVHLSDPKASAPKTTLNFDADGSLESVFALSDSLQATDPITTIDKFKIVNAGGTSRGSFSVSFYWAPFPTKFPSVVDPTKELSKDEMDLLAKLETFTVPAFVSSSASIPNTTVPRDNPFDFSGVSEEQSPPVESEEPATPAASIAPSGGQ